MLGAWQLFLQDRFKSGVTQRKRAWSTHEIDRGGVMRYKTRHDSTVAGCWAGSLLAPPTPRKSVSDHQPTVRQTSIDLLVALPATKNNNSRGSCRSSKRCRLRSFISERCHFQVVVQSIRQINGIVHLSRRSRTGRWCGVRHARDGTGSDEIFGRDEWRVLKMTKEGS